jgi:uncharacterized DUF497 family protein
MEDDEFEWHDAKAAGTAQKRGIGFETARAVFDDPFAIDLEDRSQVYDEQRFIRIGMVDGRYLFVVYTFRGDKTRIISVRKAMPYERRRYESENS